MARVVPKPQPLILISPGSVITGTGGINGANPKPSTIKGNGKIVLPFPSIDGEGQIGVSVSGNTFTDFSGKPENPFIGKGQWFSGRSYFRDWLDMQSITGRGFASNFSGLGGQYDDSLAVTDTGSPDHFVEAILFVAPGYRPPNTHEASLAIRASGGPGSCQLIEILWDVRFTYMQLAQWMGPISLVDTNFTLAGPGPNRPPQDGDTVRAEVRGSNITIMLNGVIIHTISVGAYSTHSLAGFMNFVRLGGVLSSYGYRSIKVGPLSHASTSK